MIDQAWFEAITEHSHQLIRDYIPTLAFGPAISEVADIQKQDLDHRFIVGEQLKCIS